MSPMVPPTSPPSTTSPTDTPTLVPTVVPVPPPTTKPTIAPISPQPSRSPSAMPLVRPPVPPPRTTASPTKAPKSVPKTRAPVVNTPSPTQTTLCDPPLSIREWQSALFEIASSITPEAILLQRGTSQNQAFTWLIGEDAARVCPANRLDVVQRYVMATSYFSLGGDNWNVCSAAPTNGAPATPCPNGQRYLDRSNVCQWFNVTCDTDPNSIVGIILGTSIVPVCLLYHLCHCVLTLYPHCGTRWQ
jgi:hypothetical protein